MHGNPARLPVPGRRYGDSITAIKLSADAIQSKVVGTGLLGNAVENPSSVIRFNAAVPFPLSVESYLDISGAVAKFSGDLVAAGGTFSTITAGLLANAATDATAAIRLDAASTMPASATFKIDLAAPNPTSPVLAHPGASLLRNGDANFSGNLTIDAAKTISFDSGSGPLVTMSAMSNGAYGTGLRLTLGDDTLEIVRIDQDTPGFPDSLGLNWNADGVAGNVAFTPGDGFVGTMRVNAGFHHTTGQLGFFGANPANRPVIVTTGTTDQRINSIVSALTTLGLAST